MSDAGVVGKADDLTVLCVTPIVEGDPSVPDDDRRRFVNWLHTRQSTDTLLELMRTMPSVNALGRLAEEYAWYLETECDVYAVDLMCRTETDEAGRTTITEPLTPSQRLARAKAAVRR